LVGKLLERDHIEEPNLDGNKIRKIILLKLGELECCSRVSD
jgi:hypothetical protein